MAQSSLGNPFTFDNSPPPEGFPDPDYVSRHWLKQRESEIAEAKERNKRWHDFAFDYGRKAVNLPEKPAEEDVNFRVNNEDKSTHYHGVTPAQVASQPVQPTAAVPSALLDKLGQLTDALKPAITNMAVSGATKAATKAATGFGWKALVGTALGTAASTALLTMFPWAGAALLILNLMAGKKADPAPAAPQNSTSTIERIEKFKQVFYDQDGNEIKIDRLPAHLRKN
jgi:hypothetical protein